MAQVAQGSSLGRVLVRSGPSPRSPKTKASRQEAPPDSGHSTDSRMLIPSREFLGRVIRSAGPGEHDFKGNSHA